MTAGPVTLRSPEEFRAALLRVPATERDAWCDRVLGLDAIPDDGPDLPRGCVPYLPCPVDALLRVVDAAQVQAHDVFVDVGAGVGRAAALVHLLSGAGTIGIEVQRELVARALPQVAVIHGDAAQSTRYMTTGSVFFFYCPFGRDRMESVLDDLEPIARTRPIRICCVDTALPERSWITLESSSLDLTIFRSVL